MKGHHSHRSAKNQGKRILAGDYGKGKPFGDNVLARWEINHPRQQVENPINKFSNNNTITYDAPYHAVGQSQR